MKKIELNREYARRHILATAVFVAMGCWFGYDGFVRYPATDAAALYESIEGRAPSSETDIEKFKRQKIDSQRLFSAFLLCVAAVVGLRLLKNSRLDFSWGETGFETGGRQYSFDDVVSCDLSRWKSKGILVLRVPSGRIALDSWHHKGVREFKEMLDEKSGAAQQG